MKIEVVQSTTGLVLVHVLGKDRLMCEAAHNRFLISHALPEWSLLVRSNLLDHSFTAQSVNPAGQASVEIALAESAEIRARLSELLEMEYELWRDASATRAAGGN